MFITIWLEKERLINNMIFNAQSFNVLSEIKALWLEKPGLIAVSKILIVV